MFSKEDPQDLQKLHDLVEQSWNMEALGLQDRTNTINFSKNFRRPKEEWTPNEREIDDRMKVIQVGDHFNCSIPWKSNPPNLKNNMQQVLFRQKKTNSSEYLNKKGTSIEEVNKVFEDQLSKDFFEPVPLEELDREDCYAIPYFPVINRNKPTSQVRIVFDCAAKDKDGKSLNSEIQKGPNRLQDLFSILSKFRRGKYAIIADISEMFLRCRIAPEDRRYHRFWWNGIWYQWNRILFGGKSSPDISQKVLETNCEVNGSQYPEASLAMLNETYMDDTDASRRSEKEIKDLVAQLPPLLKHADMKVCKFYSNCRNAVKHLPKELLSDKVIFADKEENDEVSETKVLGMIWNAKDDTFNFASKFKSLDDYLAQLNLPPNFKWTKRYILRLSATCWDPLGLICPFAVQSRTLLQSLWQEKLDWDTPIPEKFSFIWKNWLANLFVLTKNIKIPRHVGISPDTISRLHVFVDASSDVFACAIYVQTFKILESPIKTRWEEDQEENDTFSSRWERDPQVNANVDENLIVVNKLPNEETIDVNLLATKARVSPVKAESVARLELAAAQIGAQLGNHIATTFGIDPQTVHYWTDSKCVLYWINTPAKMMKVFVSRRSG